ncbi:MAG: Hsp20/alpha crystallin family protein [Anaerolineae bacterium]|nr:Hsp20/alpha crystallin family protein [Anaerolineae bacterium]
MLLVREPVYVNRRRYNAPRTEGENVYRLPIDAYENENQIVLTASVPGVNPESVEITLDDDTLVIRGEVSGPEAESNYVLRERFHGKFERRLMVNVPVDTNAAEATFDNGVLTLVLPKSAEAKPHRIAVKAAQ